MNFLVPFYRVRFSLLDSITPVATTYPVENKPRATSSVAIFIFSFRIAVHNVLRNPVSCYPAWLAVTMLYIDYLSIIFNALKTKEMFGNCVFVFGILERKSKCG